MPRWIPFIIATLLLAGAWFARGLADDVAFVVPAREGILYAATFNGGRFADDWTLQDRRGEVSAVTNDTLHLSIADFVPDVQALSSINRYRYRDFTLNVTAAATDGSFNNKFGVVFRLVDADNYYLFTISSDGYYAVWRVLDGLQAPLSAWIPSSAIVQGSDGEQNQLTVTAQDDQLTFAVNGTALDLCIPDAADGVSTYVEAEARCVDGTMQPTVSDGAFAVGQLGMAIETLTRGGLAVTFDNVVISAP
jgi:hypothetical protein